MVQLLRKLAFPVSLVYGLVVYIRNFLFDTGILPSKTFKTPVICIGNLSVGGTGKTPMTEFLISSLQKTHNIGVLSRGYRRKSHGFVLASDTATVEELGDEPYQIHTKFPEITVAVDTDRQHGISELEKETKPDFIVLDDAFQHRKVTPRFSILLTAYGDIYSEDWYLPTGNLRDSKKAAKRADAIIVTKCPSTLKEAEYKVIREALNPAEHQQLLFSTLRYDENLRGVNGNIDLHDLKHRKVTLVTGIANPKPLVLYLEKKKIGFEHLAYKDHHYFTSKELELFNSKELILTTEKDFMRLKGKVQSLFYIPIAHDFLDGGEDVLISAILNSLR